jgi:hypothetical protein
MSKIIDPDDLTYSVNSATNMLRFNTTAKTIQLVAGGALVAKDGVTGQCLFSKIKEAIKASSLLISVPLPVREMIHDESMELVNGWTFADSTTIKMIRDCGVAYVNTSGITTAMYACFVTLGLLPGAIADPDMYYTQSSATNASTYTFTHINKDTTFGVNELVQIYSDTNGDGTPDYDYRSYVKVFLRPASYTYDESDNTAIGYSALTYKKYNFPITCVADAGVTVDDTTLDGAGYSSLAMQWYATAQSASLGTNGPYDYHVIVTGGGKTYDQLYSWIQRQLRKTSDIDAGAGNRTGTVAASLVYMDGSVLKTRYQTVGGVHIASPSAGSYNNIKEYDDTNTLRSYPLSVSVALEFDSYLQGDADSYFWIFPTSTYGTPGAAVLTDATSSDMKGAATANTSYSYVHTTDVPITGIALGLDGAKIAEATGTITSSGAKLVFVAGLERWYNDPA